MKERWYLEWKVNALLQELTFVWVWKRFTSKTEPWKAGDYLIDSLRYQLVFYYGSLLAFCPRSWALCKPLEIKKLIRRFGVTMVAVVSCTMQVTSASSQNQPRKFQDTRAKTRWKFISRTSCGLFNKDRVKIESSRGREGNERAGLAIEAVHIITSNIFKTWRQNSFQLTQDSGAEQLDCHVLVS